MLRRSSAILEDYLPPRKEMIVFCRPTESQIQLYRREAGKSCDEPLRTIHRLLKTLNHPCTLEDTVRVDSPLSVDESAKLEVLQRLLLHFHKTSLRCVVCSDFTTCITLVESVCKSLCIPYVRLDGSTPADQRGVLIEKCGLFYV